MKRIIVDLDGTLANCDHRLNLVRRKKKWFDKFYQLAWKDKVNEWCQNLIHAMLGAGHRIEIVSARPYGLREMTLKWLETNSIPVNSGNVLVHLLRMDKDFTPDVELKRTWLHRMFASGLDKNDFLFAVDDRKRVVDMWRKEGITTLHCADWEEYNGSKIS